MTVIVLVALLIQASFSCLFLGLLISINSVSLTSQTNEPYHKKEHVKISDTAKFQSCQLKTREMAELWMKGPFGLLNEGVQSSLVKD